MIPYEVYQSYAQILIFITSFNFIHRNQLDVNEGKLLFGYVNEGKLLFGYVKIVIHLSELNQMWFMLFHYQDLINNCVIVIFSKRWVILMIQYYKQVIIKQILGT